LKVGLKELKLLVFSKVVIFWTCDTLGIFVHFQKEVIIYKGFSLLPGQLVGSAIADVTPFSEFEKIEESLENLWKLENIYRFEGSQAILPMFWCQGCMMSSSCSRRIVVQTTSSSASQLASLSPISTL